MFTLYRSPLDTIFVTQSTDHLLWLGTACMSQAVHSIQKSNTIFKIQTCLKNYVLSDVGQKLSMKIFFVRSRVQGQKISASTHQVFTPQSEATLISETIADAKQIDTDIQSLRRFKHDSFMTSKIDISLKRMIQLHPELMFVLMGLESFFQMAFKLEDN